MLSNKQHLGKIRNTVADFLCFEIYLGHYCQNILITAIAKIICKGKLVSFSTTTIIPTIFGTVITNVYNCWHFRLGSSKSRYLISAISTSRNVFIQQDCIDKIVRVR